MMPASKDTEGRALPGCMGRSRSDLSVLVNKISPANAADLRVAEVNQNPIQPITMGQCVIVKNRDELAARRIETCIQGVDHARRVHGHDFQPGNLLGLGRKPIAGIWIGIRPGYHDDLVERPL